MDKEFVVKVFNNINLLNTVNTEDAITLLTEYCSDNGKDPNLTRDFINIVMNTPFLSHCINTALQYYKRKFSVTDIIKNKQIILTY